jgi:hypothetical protein
MDKKLAKLVQEEAVAALEAIAASHGMTVRGHGGSLADISMILKFEFKTADAGAISAKEKTDFELYCSLFNLTPSDYGATFVNSGKTYKVVGFDMKRRKFPIVAIGPDGKRILFTDMVADRIRASRSAVAS